MQGIRTRVVETWLSLDPRSLGAFRIVFGCVLLSDLVRHWRVAELWYTDAGLLPGRLVGDQAVGASGASPFSLFFLVDGGLGVSIGMALCGLCYTAFTLGYHTRIAHALSLVALVSLSGRVALLENGGDTVMKLLCVWSLFLPLGRRYSLDALLRSLRARDERTVEALADRGALRFDTTRVVSLAALALLLQFACIYFFSAIQKSGDTWWGGTAVHYALHQDRIVTGFGAWLSDNSPLELLAGLGWATLAVEWIAPLLILTPFFTATARLIAILILPAMHLGFATGLNIGSFSYAMASFLPLLLSPAHWDRIEAFSCARRRRLRIFFDADCGICFLTVRILARLDPAGRLRLLANDDVAELPEGIRSDVTDATIIVVEEGSGRIFTRAAALAEVMRALPGGSVPALVVGLPLVRSGFDRLYDWISRNRTQISVRLGLAACGMPVAAPDAGATSQGPSRAGSRVRGWGVAREAAVAVLLVASAGTLLQHNWVVPRELRFGLPAPLSGLIEPARLWQGWRMFTPDAPPEEFIIAVEAVTTDGRLVDPFHEVASRPLPERLDAIPRRLGQDQFFSTYSLLCARKDLGAFYPALTRWILRHPDRTGRAEDRIERFDVVRIHHISPAPGSVRPTQVEREVLLRYPSPNERRVRETSDG